jgi:hypothetical protein
MRKNVSISIHRILRTKVTSLVLKRVRVQQMKCYFHLYGSQGCGISKT